ncbi:DUF4132 domain-containing protein [Bacillus sp. 31A1R]|uniref:DUF4132 domain-containing protein n=1 Tax=Robertmurraya mangrovi TaxID=3098077 RepID=A0ABU5J3J6_9BACI|nr:DUF4132 domain-containing protein [Bacillus sp. 31A1R]MDZ5473935.1 DUF4132 domain-containing protein [Bacillus sp. 31A1R]
MENKADYLAKLNGIVSHFTGLEREIGECVLSIASGDPHDLDPYETKLEGLLSTVSSDDIFNPLKSVVSKLVNPYFGDLFQYICEHKVEYPNTVGFDRRPFRTTEQMVHLSGIISKLYYLMDMNHKEMTLEHLIGIESSEYYFSNLKADMIAYEIDTNPARIMPLLHEMVYGENQNELLSLNVIKGMLLSHHQEAYKMLGELLIAARLQEGLRQSIVENMDEGTIDATLYLLKIILDHDLIRYSSVVRALMVWTGIELETNKPRVIKQAIQYAYDCLTNEEKRLTYLTSKDVFQVYFSLWATAVKEESDLYANIVQVLNFGEHYQKLVALSLLIQSQNDHLKYKTIEPFLAETNPEVEAFILNLYPYQINYRWIYEKDCVDYVRHIELERVPELEEYTVRKFQFNLFKEKLLAIGRKEREFVSPTGQYVSITSDLLAQKMMYLTAYDMNEHFIEELILLKDEVSPDTRRDLLEFFVVNENGVKQREFLFSSLSDKSLANREMALSIIKKLTLTSTELVIVENLLKLKTASIRQGAIQTLLNVNIELLQHSIHRLFNSKSEWQRLGGLEILFEISQDQTRQELSLLLSPMLNIIKSPTEKEKILIQNISKKETYTEENGFGLLKPSEESSNFIELEDLIEMNQDTFFTYPIEKAKSFLQGLNDLIYENRHVEYEVEWEGGFKQKVLIDNQLDHGPKSHENEREIERFPLAPIWIQYLEENPLHEYELLQIWSYFELGHVRRFYHDKLEFWEQDEFPKLNDWRKKVVKRVINMDQLDAFEKFREEIPYHFGVQNLIEAYVADCDKALIFKHTSKMLSTIINAISLDKLEKEIGLALVLSSPWIDWLSTFVHDKESFRKYFSMKYHLYTLSNYKNFTFSTENWANAYELGIVSYNELMREMLTREESSAHIYHLTERNNEILAKHPVIHSLKDHMIDRIVNIELNRGELPTEVTKLAINIRYFEGMEYFVELLSRLENETFVRGYIYSYDEKTTRKEAFSHLIQTCYPHGNDNSKKLEVLLREKQVSEKRLLEAAIYAPQWIDIVAEYLKWDGLKSTVWYFHAHIYEQFTAEKETIVAQYSPITPVEFNDGAFDIDWFKDSYHCMGEEKFQVVYDCAKYISGGANHRRAQLFADATLGKLVKEKLLESVTDKRNKDHLLSYSLIPLEGRKDLLERYEFIQTFLKESKSYGAQRRASESKIASIALSNLARNAGYKDVTRLTWDMESQKIVEVSHYFQAKSIDELSVSLVIDEQGGPEIEVIKNGKKLKSVPSKYKKHSYVLELKELKTELRDLYKRAKGELERSMETGSAFTVDELIGISHNPVIAPLIKTLVFKYQDVLGYFRNGSLVGLDESVVSLNIQDEVVIAHPYDLFISRQWSHYQKHLFDQQWKQPFKQVFRELYVPNIDELENGTISRRYSGHQIQPQKTVALLRNRNWTVSYEEGLQRVYYKENVIAKIYALADWFSPSDIEAPTIETVEFFNRNTLESIRISDIPPLIFSETMRDVDLVVSFAHVGGVDPEASLTTIEMRTVIVTESLRLMKIMNVILSGNHAIINGKLGEYSVHLGSGNVYKQASGAISIIPVHSQHRGKIFLPFMDEDPKTAEILSKIVLLAQDTKIKDPYILEQIRS